QVVPRQARANLSTQDALQFLPATDFLVRSSIPVITGAGRDLEWDTQANRCIHLPLHNLPHLGELTRSNFDDQFVMHLQKHTRLEAFEGIVDADHRDLDDVRGGALNRRVERWALS